MQVLEDNFKEQLSFLGLSQKQQKQLQIIFNENLNRCVSFLNEREAILLLNEKNEIIGVDHIFSEWFGVTKEEYEGLPFKALFDVSYHRVIEEFLHKVSSLGFYKKESLYINFRNNLYHLDLKGEDITCDGKRIKIVFLKNKSFDEIGFKLDYIEREVSNLIIRIKSFEPLMEGLIQIFIDSHLFDFGWVARIDSEHKRVIPIVSVGDEELASKFQNHMYDFDYFASILQMLVQNRDIVSHNLDEIVGEYATEIVFPIFKKWEFGHEREIAFATLVYSNEHLELSETQLNRLREVMYKINLAASDIFIKEQANIIIGSDPLTALPNRELFMKELERALDEKIPFVLVLVDLDKLRKVNDVIGFWAGDEVIKRLSRFLVKSVPESYVARVGTDEFGLLIKGEKQKIYESLDAILGFNEAFVKVNDIELYTPISVGVAFFPEDGKSKEELILLAEEALKEAKKKGGKSLEYANKNITFLPKDYLELEKELKEALDKGEYRIFYQPIIDVNKESVWGVEGLLRWQSQKRGLVPPGKFISILEESGLINEVGDYVIEQVCKDAKLFAEDGLYTVFSMNLSVIQMLSDNIAQRIIEQIKRVDVPANRIIVEITESVLMENFERIIDQIKILQEHGVKLEIDDFGTGYSSLAYLKKLPVNSLKIDRSFIQAILDNEEDRAIVQAIVSMAKALGKGVIAEGVEKKEQLALLEKMGVDYIQGFYFAKPMPKEELKAYLRNFKRE